MALSERTQITTICLSMLIVIVLYGSLRCKGDFVDPLTFSPLGAPWDKFVDGWGLSHFIFYGILGYLFPQKLIFISLVGIGWELTEMIFKDHPFYISKCKYVTSDNEPGWWYGRWQDIVMNTLGMVLGASIATYGLDKSKEMKWAV